MITTTFDQALVTLATWLLAGGGCWALVLCAAALLESATSGRVRATLWVGCPPRLRRARLSGLGLALAGGGATAPAALADTQAPPAELPVPARAVGDLAATAPAASLVVRPGDSLWRLAAVRAGPHASADDIAALVQRFHHRNRRVIGPDPDLLHPGQRLVVPALVRHPDRRRPAHRRPDHPQLDRSHEERP